MAGAPPAVVRQPKRLPYKLRRRDEIDAIGINLDHLRALGFEAFDHLLEQVATYLSYARSGVEVGEVTLGETEIAVEAVDQDLEGVLQCMVVALLLCVLGRAHI